MNLTDLFETVHSCHNNGCIIRKASAKHGELFVDGFARDELIGNSV